MIELARIRNMLGRKHQIHLRRYSSSNADDVSDFASIVRAYGDRLNCPELLNNLEVLYTGSLGCIGLLRAWLLRSAVVANARGIALNIETVRQQQLPSADLREILREIEQGEGLLEIDAVFPSKKTVGSQKKKDSKSGRKPFSRNPRRYSAGNRNGLDA